MTNRIAELESAVAQLNATVDGLQEELVDANERIRELERQLEDDDDDQSAAEPESATDQEIGVGQDSDDEDESDPIESDDIIVA